MRSWRLLQIASVVTAIAFSPVAVATTGEFAAYKAPTAAIPGCGTATPCDHTYAKVDGTVYSVKISGNSTTSSGGTMTWGMSVATGLNSTQERCFASCMTNVFVYLVDGTCHQQTNSSLSYGSSEALSVTNVAKYSVTRAIYGKFGLFYNLNRNVCRSSCGLP